MGILTRSARLSTDLGWAGRLGHTQGVRIGGHSQIVVKAVIWGGAVVTAPLLLVAGGPVYDRYVRHLCREGGPGLVDKQKGWVHPGYWVVTNGLVRALTWPTRRGGAIRSPTVSSR